MRLDRVTVTGADDSTPVPALFRLAQRFPFVEWGILLSKSQEGRPRFPSSAWIDGLLEADEFRDLQLSGHLCGSWVRDLCLGIPTFETDRPTLAGSFQRVQLNFHAVHHTVRLHSFVEALVPLRAEQFIFQLDAVNDPILDTARARGINAVPLFDLSGGAGILPAAWPKPSGDYCGYAGGLSPANLREQLAKIAEAAGDSRVWIDVETHVRSDQDRVFDLNKVERFLDIAADHVVEP